MKRFIRCLIQVVLVFMSATGLSASADEVNYQGAKLVTNNNGTITSMVYAGPATYLNIEKEFLFTLNADGTPANCTITFNNGVQREMKPGEMTLHFAQCGGPKAVWDYYKEHGTVVSYNPGNGDKVPSGAFGKVSRLIVSNGREFIGRLSKLADKSDGFSLVVDNTAPIQFYDNTVKEVQQLK